ncbi:MAG: hypothetical protein K1X67_04675 [Fimbriimonadaceae bacterium]|nr:hypothetical protein [Fimbriimonadaceae bacterium]
MDDANNGNRTALVTIGDEVVEDTRELQASVRDVVAKVPNPRHDRKFFKLAEKAISHVISCRRLD